MGSRKSLEARLNRLRSVRNAFSALVEELEDQITYFFGVLWNAILRIAARLGFRTNRTPERPQESPWPFASRPGEPRWVRSIRIRLERASPPIKKLWYGIRWLDVHQRLWAVRIRRYLRNYFVVLIDPDVPVMNRSVHGLKGAGTMAAAGVMALVIYTIALIPQTPNRQTIRQLGTQHPAVVLDINGEVITRYRHVNREWVELHDVSPYFINALLTTEDRRFYEHIGIDFARIFGAGLKTIGGDTQGGSTLTQQLARNLFPEKIGRRVTLDRKLKEIVTALKIEAIYSKEEILESYINTVPFLFNAVGVEMAARTYFDKAASELDVLESATLVGMLKGTYFYNPVRNPERAVERRNLVLATMAQKGSLAEDELQALTEEPLSVNFEVQEIRDSRAPHFTEYVRRWLVRWADEHGYSIYTDSLIVHTTLDLRLQDIAEEALRTQTEALQAVADVEWSGRYTGLYSTNAFSYLSRRRRVEPFDYFWSSRDSLVNSYLRATREFELLTEAGVSAMEAVDSLRANEAFMDSLRAEKTRLEAGFLAISPRSGHVKAWVGSREFERDEFDHVVQAKRQAGSTFKPFLYAAALEAGFSPYDRFTDQPVSIRLSGNREWRPKNSGDYSYRDMTLRDALAHSVNTISAQLVERVGPDRVADLARRAGVHSELDEVPSIALGTSSVSLAEMVTAFATLAAGGVYTKPVSVLRVESRHGEVLFEAPVEREDVISESVTSDLIDMMRAVIDEGTGRRIRFAYDIDTDVAGKTGTTQESADGWFLLMHPDLVAGAWVGFDDRRITFRSNYWGQGAHTALPIVGEFFRDALRDRSLGLENRPAPASEIRYVRTHRSGVEGWLRDVFDSPVYERVVVEHERPKSNLGLRTTEESPQN